MVFSLFKPFARAVKPLLPLRLLEFLLVLVSFKTPQVLYLILVECPDLLQ